jgi:hypothetical protein
MPAALRTRLRPPVAADEILRAQRRPVGELHVDSGFVLHEARHLAPVKGRHGQLPDPGGQDALDVVLPQREAVVVPCGKIADVQREPGEAGDLCRAPFREEPLGDAALIQHLEGACVQAAGARAGELLIGTPLDDRHIDARQRQLAGQHQPGWTPSGDHHRVLAPAHLVPPL